MGLREKVTITLVIIALIQIACRHCMPRTPRKASFKRYLNDLKPVKNNPVPTPHSPSRVNKLPKQTFGKTAQNSRISQNPLPKKSLQKTYNFPENEYPLDNSPRDPWNGMNFNENYHVNTLQKAHNLQSSAISDLKKEMKMKRKLLSNKQVHNENSQLKTDMSSIKSASTPEPIRLLDSGTFPEVQYPLNTMDTLVPNYWNYLPFTQEKPVQEFGQQIFNPKAKQDINKPFTRLTKAKASKYLQSYDKLKEEHKRTSTENSKRSNVGQKGLNFTKTETCEGVSDDFITAGLVSNIPSNSTELKNELTSSTKITSSENTCPVTEYLYHQMPIPYKVIEENTENICPAHSKNKTKELEDVDNRVIAQTLQLIQEILFKDDDTSLAEPPGNFSKELETNMNTSDYTVVPENENISTTLMDSAKSCTVSPTEELKQVVSGDDSANILQNKMSSLPAEIILDNTTTDTGPLNVRMPLPFSEPVTLEALTNVLKPGLNNMIPLPNSNAATGSTSIIIIPINNSDFGKSKSHMFETTSDSPIIVYLPSTQSSGIPSQTPPSNQIVSPSLDNTMPNNQLYNVLSNMAPLQNDNPFSTTLVSELLNNTSDINSDSGSFSPIYETLPTNSMCYNNESSPSSMRVKPVSDILVDKSLADDAPFVTTTCDEKLSEQPTETGDLHMNTDTLAPISDFEHPLFDFSGSDFTSLSHGPYNNILHNELPIIAREIDSDPQLLNVPSKDLFIPTQNVTSEHLNKTTSMDSVSEDSLSETPNDVSPLNKNFSSVISTDSIEILKTNTLLPESIPNLQEPVDTLTESPPQLINESLLSTPLIESLTAELPLPTNASLTPAPLSETLTDKLPEILDVKLSTTSVSDTTTDSAPQHIGNMLSPPILNSSLMMTDMTLKTELYKIRQILDKMLSTETPTYSQPPHIHTTLLPLLDSDGLLLPINEMPTESLPVPAVDKTLLPLPATDSPIDSLRQVYGTLPSISVDGIPRDALPLPGKKLVTPIILLETDTLPLHKDETVPPTLVSDSFADNKPYLLENLIAPMSSRTKDTSDNGLSHKMDDLPFKMDLKFPDVYEVSIDNVPLSVDDLPTKVHPEYTTNPGNSTNDLLSEVVETFTPVSKVPVRDLPKPTYVFSLPVDEGASPDVLTDGVKTIISSSINRLLQDFRSTKVPSEDLLTLPLNEFELSIHETFPDGQFNEISSKGPPQKVHLSILIEKLIPDLSLSDALTNEPSLKGYSPSLIIHKNIEFPYSTADTKDLPLALEHLLSPENEVTPDSSATDIPSAVSLSSNLEGLQFTNLDKTSDELLPKSTPSDLPRDDLPLPEDKMLSFIDNIPNLLSLPINKTPSTLKLPITKTLLVNVVSDITKGGLSSLVPKDIPVIPHSQLGTPLHYVDVKSQLSEAKDIPLRPVNKIFPNSEHTDNLIDYEPFSKKPEDLSSFTDLSSELPLSMDKMHKIKPYIPTDLDTTTHNLPVLIDKVSHSKDTTKTPSSSKLPISKALLENVLTYITTRGFSVPVAQSLPVRSPSVQDKTLYYVESPIPHITENSPSLPVDKILPNTSLFDHPTDNLPISTEDTLPLTIDKTFSEIQSLDIPTELTTPIDYIRPDIPIISMYDEEQNKIEIPSSKNPTHDLSSASPMEGIISLSRDTPSDLTLPNIKTPSSSKLPITRPLLENVLSDINTTGFSLPVAKPLPVTSPSVQDKTLHYVESPISHITENSSSLPVDKILPNNSLSDHPTDNLPISTEDTLPLPIDKTFSEFQSLDIPTELTTPIENIRPEIPIISMYHKEQDNIENPSSKNPTHDLSSASPMEGILSLSRDTPNDQTLPNIQTPSSSKLPITKALLENVLSDVNTTGFSLPVAKALSVTSSSVQDKTIYYVESPISHITENSSSLPVGKILPNTSLSDHPTDNLPISTEDTLPLPIDKTFSEFHSLNIPLKLTIPIDNIRPKIPVISMYDKEQDKIENSFSENLIDDLSSASPMEGILSLSKDTPSDQTLPNIQTPSSSKLPITKALLENVLSDVNTTGFSLPVAKALPVTSSSVQDKTLHYVESPISHITENSSSLPVGKILPNNSLSDHPTDNLPISTEDTLPLPIDKTFSEFQSLDIPTELTTPIENIRPEIPIISMYHKEQDNIENPSSKNPTHDLSSASPMEGILSLSRDTPNDQTLPNIQTPSSSKLPITKALLENVLSDVNTTGFSLPVAKALSVTSSSVQDKTIYYVESPISHITENSSSLPVGKILPNTSLSDHPTDNLPVSTEDTLPLPIDKTFSEFHSLNIPLELTIPIDNIRPKIPVISMYDKEQDKIENSYFKNLIDDLSSASPMEGILSLSRDTPSDQTLPNIQTPSSSKLPITKALLENVLSDVNTTGFSLPVAKPLPVTSSSVQDKTLYYVESHITENSSSLPVGKILPNTSLSDHPTDNLPISTEDTLPLTIDKTFSEFQSLDIPTELTTPIENIRPDIPIISMYDKEQDKIENPYSENLTDDLSSASPMEGILSLSRDTPSDQTLPNIQTPSSSKLPITKALLENVLSDINTTGFSLPVAKALPVTSPSVQDKTIYYVESPISHITENSSSLPVDKILPNNSLSDHPIDNLPISTEDALPLPIDTTFSELQSLNIPTQFSLPIDNIRPDIPIISMYDKEQDKIEDPSSENLTHDLSSASPMEGILSLSKDTPSDQTLQNIKTPSSSKLPITKALLENVLSDINTTGFSLPVTKPLPRSQLDKTLYFLESPVSVKTEKVSVIPTDNFPSSGINEDVTDNLILNDIMT